MHVTVCVSVKAKKERVEKVSENTYFISVSVPARNNLANKRVREIIASEENVSLKDVIIVSGHRKEKKILSVRLLNE